MAGAAWLLLGASGPGTSPTPAGALPTPAGASPTPAAPAQAAVTVAEPVEEAVARLARGRASAFGTATVQALGAVDEPGSPAMHADAGLIGRLNVQGVRLDGLTFEMSGVRRAGGSGAGVPGDGRAATVMATVVTSAHRQVAVRDGAVRATVSASPPRRVILTLVPASDGRRWLIRDVREATPGAVSS